MDGNADIALSTRRVLLIEDSSVTKDLLELVLSQAGHTVTAAETGAAALEALLVQDFDIVLTDFHLPDFSGLEVVRRFDESRGAQARPIFVAVTGDTKGLLEDEANCELFDRIIPKPLDIDVVCDLIAQPMLTDVVPGPRAQPTGGSNDFGLSLLDWPPGPGPVPAPGLPGIDAIRIREARDLHALWKIRGASTLPVLDATGGLEASADIDISKLTLEQVDDVRRLVELYHDRRAQLHPDLRRSDEPSDRLLARIAVAGGRLEARLCDRHHGLVAWNTICDTAMIPDLVDKLASESLVRTEFFERVHTCPDCRSARVIVREECGTCRSPRLVEESYLHHFRCATQAPESAFQNGDDLICPKCRRELRHFGRDYDRPGLLMRCEACGATISEPQIAFVCALCHTRTAAEAMPVTDMQSAEITDAGRAYLRSGAAFLGAGHRALRFGEFPIDLVVALNRSAAAYNEDRTPFTLAALYFRKLEDVQLGKGALRARDGRRQWLETLRQALGDEGLLASGSISDFVLLPRIEPDQAQELLDPMTAAANDAVRDDLSPEWQLFGPEDITR